MDNADQKLQNQTTIPEHARVRLVRDVGSTPAGLIGTVVHCYPGGTAYEVEFTSPTFSIEAMRPADLEIVNDE